VSRRTETPYKAESLGKAAQHVNVRGTGDTVNGAAAQGKFTFLSGETCSSCGIVLFSVRIPAGATGFQMSRHRWRSDSALSVRDETKKSRQETNYAASHGAIRMVREQESAEAIVAQSRE
jgi:hypothetical protein